MTARQSHRCVVSASYHLQSLTKSLEFSDMTSSVIYARVPDVLKDAAEAYAGERGTTLTSAVVDLLGRGLAAVSDERSVAELEENLAGVMAEKAQLGADLQALRAELAALRSFAQPASRPVGTCPNPDCGHEITGYDLLAAGRCQACGHSLSGLIAPAERRSSLDQREYLILLGALGALLGVAYLASK